MTGWLAMLGAVFAAEPEVDAEIVVYGGPLSPWHDTRWWVASETVDPDSPMELSFEGRTIYVLGWQIESMLHCDVTEQKREGGFVECAVERAALRVVTLRSWQRPADQRFVNRILANLTQELGKTAIRLRVRGTGTVVVPPEQPDRGEVAGRLLDQAISGFHLELPGDTFEDGARWFTHKEPLLDLNLAMGTYGFERAVHYANHYEGRNVVQTMAKADRTVVVGIRDAQGRLRGRRSRDGLQGMFGIAANRMLPGGATNERTTGGVTEYSEAGTLELHGVADYDTKLGGIRERVWTIRGTGASATFRSGRLRKLKDDEVVELGVTAQVSPPVQARLDFPRWVALGER